jgi:hypothetical protein
MDLGLIEASERLKGLVRTKTAAVRDDHISLEQRPLALVPTAPAIQERRLHWRPV